MRAVIDDGLRTADIYAGEGTKVGTREMGAAVVEKLKRMSDEAGSKVAGTRR